MKKEQAITLVSLVVTIIILIILAGVSINLVLGENGIITKTKQAKTKTEQAKLNEEIALNELYMQIESEEGSNPNTSIAKLAEFKKAIADYIEEAGGIKPEYTAETITFGESIKGIVKEVTKDATATADNIAEGETAWVNGELVTGNGADNKSYYKQGYDDAMSIPYVTKSISYFTGTTSAGGAVSKTYTASSLGVTKIVGLKSIGTETTSSYQVTAGHNGSIEISADGKSATVTWYVSYGGASIKCYLSLICIE